MNKGFKSFVVGMCAMAPVFAQGVKPAESTSKVKKVLRFSKVGSGEYIHTDGQRDLLATLNSLATSKGFTLTNQSNDAVLTESYLKDFQVIIWDNNVGNAVTSTANRDAVIKYVNDGGGWLLVHGAGDHKDAWPALKDALQTKFSGHGAQGPGDVVMDKQGLAHKELKWMMSGWAEKVRFTKDEWYSFQNSVRGRQNITVVATAANGGTGAINPPRDGSNDLTYIFAREMGKGRMLYTAMGHGGNEFYSQASGSATSALWEKMRYVAGDFQNGCTTAGDAKFNAAARVQVADSCAGPSSGLLPPDSQSDFIVSKGDQKIRLNLFHTGKVVLTLRDIRGSVVWRGSVDAASYEVALGASMKHGVYQLHASNGKNVGNYKLGF